MINFCIIEFHFTFSMLEEVDLTVRIIFGLGLIIVILVVFCGHDMFIKMYNVFSGCFGSK